MNKEEYHKYLASREWALLREQVRERSGNKCEVCRIAPMEQCHHLTYARVGHELLEDLQGICRACHEYQSGKRDKPNAEAFYYYSLPMDKKLFSFAKPHDVPELYRESAQKKWSNINFAGSLVLPVLSMVDNSIQQDGSNRILYWNLVWLCEHEGRFVSSSIVRIEAWEKFEV